MWSTWFEACRDRSPVARCGGRGSERSWGNNPAPRVQQRAVVERPLTSVPFIACTARQELPGGRANERMKQGVVRRRDGSTKVGAAETDRTAVLLCEFLGLAKEPRRANLLTHDEAPRFLPNSAGWTAFVGRIEGRDADDVEPLLICGVADRLVEVIHVIRRPRVGGYRRIDREVQHTERIAVGVFGELTGRPSNGHASELSPDEYLGNAFDDLGALAFEGDRSDDPAAALTTCQSCSVFGAERTGPRLASGTAGRTSELSRLMLLMFMIGRASPVGRRGGCWPAVRRCGGDR